MVVNNPLRLKPLFVGEGGGLKGVWVGGRHGNWLPSFGND